MPAHQVFCSHCGSAQMLDAVSGTFLLHCLACEAVTIGLGAAWDAQKLRTQIPLPPVVSYRESEFACHECEASLSVEVTMRSTEPACARCSQTETWTAGVTQRQLVSSALTNDELAFLGQTKS